MVKSSSVVKSHKSINAYQYNSQLNKDQVENNLKGRNLATEAISSERKRTFFQRYVFDAYNYQQYFVATTNEIISKVTDGLWPFDPKNQPDELVVDFQNFLTKQNINFIGRDPNKEVQQEKEI